MGLTASQRELALAFGVGAAAMYIINRLTRPQTPTTPKNTPGYIWRRPSLVPKDVVHPKKPTDAASLDARKQPTEVRARRLSRCQQPHARSRSTALIAAPGAG